MYRFDDGVKNLFASYLTTLNHRNFKGKLEGRSVDDRAELQ